MAGFGSGMASSSVFLSQMHHQQQAHRVIELQVNWNDNSGGESQLDSVFLSFELKYLTPKIGSYIKLKLLKSSIWCKNFKTLSKRKMLKTFRGNLPYFTKLPLFSYF